MGRKIVLHLHTNISDKKPSPSNIMTGELAINYAANGETLYIKNSKEEIAEFKDDKYYQKQLSELATKNELAQKQDIISDIDTIRNDAANYKGTVTSVTVNGSSKTPSSGIVDIGNVATSITVNGSSKTPSSGVVNIGNVATSVKVDGVSKTPSNGVVDAGYVNKQLITSTSSTMTLSPNIYYRNTSTSLSTLTITLGSITNSNIINEYFVEFTTSSSGTTISLPSTIKWANGEAPTFEASTTYQISIVNNLGVVITFK